MANEGYPRPPSTQSTCLKAAGITCLVVVVVGIAFAALAAFVILRNPAVKRGRLALQCRMNLQNPNEAQDISDALERYVRRNGKYPARLEDLYPNFLEEKTILHCPADPRPADVASYQYTPPAMDALPSIVVVKCYRHRIIPDQPPLVILLRKNGQLTMQETGSAPYRPR